MKDKLSFPAFTHDSIAGYCNDNALYAQYKNDKKSKYIGTKQMWQELSKLMYDLEITRKALEEIRDETGEDRAGFSYVVLATNMKETAEKALEQIEHKD